MNKNARHKDIIDQTIISLKEKYPEMGTFLNLDYNNKFDILHTIIEFHEESMIVASEEGKALQLPFIGRLVIKQGKILYNNVVDEYIEDNELTSKKDLTDEDRLNIANIVRKRKLEENLSKSKNIVETRVLTFKLKC